MKKPSISIKTRIGISGISILVMLVIGLSAILIMPEDEIILIKDYQNYAWGHVNRGYFMDTSGDIYCYCFEKALYCMLPPEGKSDIIERLEIIREHTEPCAKVPLSTVRKIYINGMMIPVFSKMLVKGCGYDGGQKSIYSCNPLTNRITKCQSLGDAEKTSLSWNARRIAAIVQEELSDIERDYNSGSFVTSKEITIETKNCEHIDKSKKYCLFYGEQLKELEKEHDFQLDSMWAKMDENDKYRYVYLVEFIKTDTPEKVPEATGVLMVDGNLDFVVDGDRADAVGNEAGDGQGICYIAAYPYDNITFFPEQYFDWDGQEWIVPAEGDVISDPLTYRDVVYGVSDEGSEKIRKEYQIGINDDIAINTAEEYEKLVTFCDENHIWEDESILTDNCLRGEYRPDFSQVLLQIRFTKIHEGDEVVFGRIHVAQNEISPSFKINHVGGKDSYKEKNTNVVIFSYIPKKYIPENE